MKTLQNFLFSNEFKVATLTLVFVAVLILLAHLQELGRLL